MGDQMLQDCFQRLCMEGIIWLDFVHLLIDNFDMNEVMRKVSFLSALPWLEDAANLNKHTAVLPKNQFSAGGTNVLQEQWKVAIEVIEVYIEDRAGNHYVSPEKREDKHERL
jgi:hypothetical protein